MASGLGAGPVRREYAVAVFVVHDGAVLLHYHQKLARWLPPGGHVDPDELPNHAAIRETREEVGLEIEIVAAVTAGYQDVDRGSGTPPRLPNPIGIQLEYIPGRPGNPAHQHIDFVYAAKVREGPGVQPIDVEGGATPGWFGPEEWVALGLTPEVVSWAGAAIRIAEDGARHGVGENL